MQSATTEAGLRIGELSLGDRMLWLNPTDNQGVRFLVEEVRTRTAWVDRHEWT
jgi:hypothetical protein